MTIPIGQTLAFMKPKFTHDCTRCIFLGHYNDHDVYTCHNTAVKYATVVARYGSNGPEYSSVPWSLFRERILVNFDRMNHTIEPPFREQGKPLDYEVAILCALTIHGAEVSP